MAARYDHRWDGVRLRRSRCAHRAREWGEAQRGGNARAACGPSPLTALLGSKRLPERAICNLRSEIAPSNRCLQGAHLNQRELIVLSAHVKSLGTSREIRNED